MVLLGDERERWKAELRVEREHLAKYREQELQGRIERLEYWKKARGTKNDFQDLNQEADAETQRVESVLSGKRLRFVENLIDYLEISR